MLVLETLLHSHIILIELLSLNSMYRSSSPLFVLAPHDLNVAVVYPIVLIWPCSGKTMVSLLHVGLIICRYLIFCVPTQRLFQSTRFSELIQQTKMIAKEHNTI